MGKIIAVCTSQKKGMKKKNVGEAILKVGFGLEGDAHGGDWHRMVSLLGVESIKKMTDKGVDVGPGDFAENLTTEGLELFTLPIGTKLKIGETSIGEVTQIGKECHTKCQIFKQLGECVMPKEGIFIRLLEGGVVRSGDSIEVMA
ncbi:MAG TPA: MOSC domain-containing protein [Desulfosporosinus sp.]|jgi:MOSC domain-containing protein YiiM|nr:MOSC domain-containing protein [Desulfosporosinus sp.]